MKTDDLGWGVRSDPPPPHGMCWPKQNEGVGVLGGHPKNKKMLRIIIYEKSIDFRIIDKAIF